MRIDEVLEGIRFGVGVAENEVELERYFVRTPAFWDVVQDEVHVVVGGKGSGKTAIAKILTLPAGHVKELADVTTINAFATNANRLFRAMNPDTDEHRFRALWMNYFVGLVGNHMIKSESVDEKHRVEILNLMQRAHLPVDTKDGQEIWHEIAQSVYPDPNLPATSVDSAILEAPRWFEPDYDFEPLLDRLLEAIAAAGVRYWIVLDRLDDAFSDRPSLEVPALRGLLRAFMDLVDKGPLIRTKIFLRSDAFERIVEEQGFVNLDHAIDLSVTLSWNHEEITRVLASRIATSMTFPLLNVPLDPHMDVVKRVIPGHISYFTGRRHQTRETLNWCIEVTQSMHDQPSPRNILDLLREARRVALTRLHSSGAEYTSGDELIGFKDLRDAWSRISRNRLQGLYGENNEVRRLAESFRGQSARATRATLTQRVRAVDPDVDPGESLGKLLKSGLIFAPNNVSLEVLPLYIPALEIGRTGARDDQYVIVADGLENSDQLRDRAKELGRALDYEAAVNLLTTPQDVPSKNAVLAANLAIQSREPSLLRLMDSFLRRPAFCDRLRGKRAVIAFALEEQTRALGLLSDLAPGEALYRAMGDFIGGLTSDGELEYSVWRWICQQASLDKGDLIPLAPVVASMRVLAVARSRSPELKSFPSVCEKVVQDWFSPPNEYIARRIDEFIDLYLKGDSELNAQFYPYQLVSMRYVRGQMGVEQPQVDEVLAAHLAARLSLEDDEKQSHFRDWAVYSEFASDIARRVSGAGKPSA